MLLFAVMVIPILLLNFYGNSKAEQILKGHVTNAYLELNKQNLDLINRDIDTVNKVTTTIIQNPITQSLVPRANETVYQRVRKFAEADQFLASYSVGVKGGEAVYYSLYVYDPNDDYAFAPYDPQIKKAGVYFFSDESKPVWFDEAVRKRGTGYLAIIDDIGTLPNKTTLAYIRSVTNISLGTGVIGVLVTTNMDEKISESLRSVSLPDGGIYLTDWHNRILAAANRQIGDPLALPENHGEWLAGIGTTDFIASGFLHVMSYDAALQQKLIYQIPIASLLQKQNELKHVIQLISIVYTAVTSIMMIYFWRSLMTPLQRLAVFVRSYEPGRKLPAAAGKRRKDEVGVVVSSVYDMAGRLNTLIEDRYQMQIREKEAQLQILYHQINPHLLYNTLESIYWKSSLEGNSESAEMIKELSRLMKISLSRGRELITIKEELEHAAAYIGLQEKRYQYGFRVEWDVDTDIEPFLIPKITLQPLLENAMIHGVRNMEDDGIIRIHGQRRGDEVVLRVEDNGYKEVDFTSIDRLLREDRPNPSLGYGIRNIHQRIQLHFGSEYGLSYGPKEGGGTVVTIVMPTRTEEQGPAGSE
ncbi:sensor histidine kinase [Paenibacillus xanthanilyticus]|uniref:Sensor histidine kinase n=1 Tax=Paenibacillus xanthanilyticus TaxID=1783531 RepID=A0ABV8JZF6_9BACL